jgi:SAM-dependent methyltransferase
VARSNLDDANAEFWDEVCGTELARTLTATDDSRESIEAVDRAFFASYPFLARYVAFEDLDGRDVIGIGLGYGSVSHRLCEKGRSFVGLDIARGPVDWVNYRLRLFGLSGKAQQGSVLDAPFADESFDVAVAIGCYHHTGNIERAIAETARILRPGGRAVVMVYNATSYLCWLRYPRRTLNALYSDDPIRCLTARERLLFDRNSKGNGPPETVLLTKSGLRRIMARHFKILSIERTNVIPHWPFEFVPRRFLNALFGRCLGLDLYASAFK